MRYSEFKIEDFLNKTASTDSMPGGGTVSALIGANALALALKVCNLSLGKERYKENEGLIKESIAILEEKKQKFLDFMDEDAKSFKAMEEVYKLPKVTDEDKKKRKVALAHACQICSKVPIDIINEAIASMGIVSKLVGKTNVSAESDLIIAKTLLKTTVRCAWENVEINRKYIDDEEYLKVIDDVKKRVDAI